MLWLGKHGRVYMSGWLFLLNFGELEILGEHHTSNHSSSQSVLCRHGYWWIPKLDGSLQLLYYFRRLPFVSW